MLMLTLLATAPATAQPDRPARVVEPLRRLHLAEDRLADGAGDRLALHFERLGALYLLAVDDEARMDQGLVALDSVRVAYGAEAEQRSPGRLDGYLGAFTVLRAKHAFWPHHKLGHVKDGMRLLDAAVATAPDDAVVRYLRLMSGFYLPSIFGRGDEVRADFAALARLLPGAAPDFPGEMYGTVIRFVLDHGAPAPEHARALTDLLGAG